MKYYVLVDVGCIECGEETNVLGVYNSLAKGGAAFKAKAAKEGEDVTWPKGNAKCIAYMEYFTHGQRSLELHCVQS